jgi:hypothetical protein
MRELFFACLLLVLAACSDKPARGILTQPEMQGMIWDMMQVDEFATGYLYNDTSLVLANERLKLYKDVFRLHKISEKTFADSYRYYAARPDMMKEMFDSLTARGERERKLLYMPKDTVPVKPVNIDSLKKDSITLTADSLRKDTAR